MSLLEVTSETYENEVSNSERPVIVDFYAKWCGPCKMLAPILEQIQVANPTTIKIVKVDVEENEELAKLYSIRNVPTMLFIEDDAIVDRRAGTLTKTSLEELIRKNFNTEIV